jgi:hypothetical protein
VRFKFRLRTPVDPIHPWLDDASLGHFGSIAETHATRFVIH